MADTKITSLLTPQVTTNPATDVLPIVNIADTSMASSGSTRKITVNTLLGAGGTATLASATITGDLTVDTSTLKVDSANDRVGIGTASPGFALDVQSATGTVIRIKGGSGSGQGSAIYVTAAGSTSTFFAVGDRANIFGGTPDVTASIYTAPSIPLTFDVGGSTAMTLNSTGLGVGVGPTNKLDVNGNAAFTGFGINANPLNATSTSQRQVRFQNTGGDFYLGIEGSTGGGFFSGSTAYAACLYNAANTPLQFFTNGTLRSTIDTAGNVGIGVTPAGTGGCLQLKSGVTFPATQVASSDANTLDDYEEGTFTPVIIGTSTAGTGTYTTQQGRYTKIGNQVTVHIFLDWSAHTGTGNLKLAGLPFQSSNNFHACSIGFWNNIAVTAANVPMAYVINSETNISLIQMPSGGGAMVAIPMDTAGAFILSATYTV